VVDKTLDLLGSRAILTQIKASRDPMVIALQWQARLHRFCRLRSKYLLY
jgi:hypothetical protein